MRGLCGKIGGSVDVGIGSRNREKDVADAAVKALQTNIDKDTEKNTEMKASLSYDQLAASVIESHTLIINTSPVGMYPNVNEAPPIAYEGITAQHHLYDLVYNPTETLFMQ